MNGRPTITFEFGEFRLIPAERVFLRGGSPVTLAPKAFDVLVVLVENAGELVEKQDLMQRVWPESFVEEANVQVQISAIRKVIGRNISIETVPKRGYRFKSTVKRIGYGFNEFQRPSLEHGSWSAPDQQEYSSREIS